MKNIFLIFLFMVNCWAIEQKTNLSIKYINYDDFQNELLYYGDTKLEYIADKFSINSKIKYWYSNQYTQKRSLDLDELYLTKEYEDAKIEFGKIIKFQGELEGYNIADIFNQKDYHFDPFDKSAKNGSFIVSGTKYIQNDSFELGLKLYEENKEYPKVGNPYDISSLNYDKNLKTQSSRYSPTIYLKYNFLTDEKVQSDNKIMMLNGYDNKRYFIPQNQSIISSYAYKVNKLLFLSNIVYWDTIFKFETSYTDVISDRLMSDYWQLSFGMENGFYNIGGVDINLYTEYYKYQYKDDRKIKNVDISEVYDDDIFVALKFNFNDPQSTSVKSGILFDRNNSEKVFKLEFQQRIIDGLVLSGEILNILSKQNTVLTNLGNHTRSMIALTYTF
ncbi:MAG: hypothetical protein PHG81_02330 [Aliarcobacter sp.]|nr:hypothetical protein [Aliarcobacter sp.]